MDVSGIKIFQADDGRTEIQVVVQAETVWLSQRQLADLFEKDSGTIGLHLRNIYKSGELNEKATTVNTRQFKKWETKCSDYPSIRIAISDLSFGK